MCWATPTPAWLTPHADTLSTPPHIHLLLCGSNGITAMGVADGVYMWKEKGIDAGMFRCAVLSLLFWWLKLACCVYVGVWKEKGIHAGRFRFLLLFLSGRGC